MLDEPTNDLDVETLDLLEELVADYDGTVLLVSHDRDFIDRVATDHRRAWRATAARSIYAGGWTDYRAQRGEDAPRAGRGRAPRRSRTAPPARRGARAPRLSFTQAHRLEALPGEIDRLAAEIGRLEVLLADPGLYARDPARFAKAGAALAARQAALAAAEDEWLRLEELREATDG